MKKKKPDVAEPIDATGPGPGPIGAPGPIGIIAPEHAEFSPSSLGMFEKCPGYRNRGETTNAAEKGHRIHLALQKNLIPDLDEEERPIAQKCQDYIDATIAEHLPKLPDKDYREIRLDMDFGNEIYDFGTADRLIIYGDTGYLIDFKSGLREITDAEQNAQGFAYVIGVFQKFPELKKIEISFLIPQRDQVSYHTFTRADIPQMTLRLNTIIRRAMPFTKIWSGETPWTPKFEAMLNPQPELCEYCAMQSICPALAGKALTILGVLGKGLPVPANVLVSKSRSADITHLLRLAPLMEEWAAGVRAEALRLNLEEGVAIPGFKRWERAVPRNIRSVVGAWRVFKEKYPHVSEEEFLAACSKVSMPALEDLVAEQAKYGEKGPAKKALENELRHRDLLGENGKIFYLREAKS